MKKILSALLVLGCILTLSANAADGEKKKEKKELSPEAKAVMKEITAKYDANKDGKLDKEERAKISAEDKEKMTKVGIGGDKKKKE
jgi:hypothetical protein